VAAAATTNTRQPTQPLAWLLASTFSFVGGGSDGGGLGVVPYSAIGSGCCPLKPDPVALDLQRLLAAWMREG